MQTLADMRGVGVKNRRKYADVLCGRPPSCQYPMINYLSQTDYSLDFPGHHAFCFALVFPQKLK